MQDLGTLGGASSQASAINDGGQVAGLSTTGSDEFHAFLWAAGTMRDLGAAGRFSVVGLNAAGHVVWTGPAGTDTHGFVWDGSAARDLGTLGGCCSSVAAINNRGQIVGSSSTAAGDEHAFLWQDGVMTDLGSFHPVALNERGQVTGSYLTADFRFERAVVWQDGALTELGALPGDASSHVVAINDAGDIVGTSALSFASDDRRAFLWRSGALTQLNAQGQREDQETPAAIDNAATAAGRVFLCMSGVCNRRAAVWTDGQAFDLGTLGGARSQALAIDARGDIVGWSDAPPPPDGSSYV
jgi:probable HAF family extracellular repeat protein